MNNEEHRVTQKIRGIDTYMDGESMQGFVVGFRGVTRIEACQKSGMHANIPYVRVWAGDTCIAEFCQHNIVGIYFSAEQEKEL